jgi:hypothetical protein
MSSSSSRGFRSLSVVAGAILAFAVFSPAAQAKRPNPGYEQFAGCPTYAEYADSNVCMHIVITGGHLKLGNKELPIEKPMTLTGGVKEFGQPAPLVFNSEGGLSKVKQRVPGGVSLLTGMSSLTKTLGKEAQTVYATTELAAAPTFSFSGPARLPIKIHLESSALGNNCYLGSNASPLLFSLITGTTTPPAPAKPITGKAPFFRFEEVREIQEANGGIMVDNAFAVPGANGCVLSVPGMLPLSINGLINSAMGLPATAGRSEAVMNLDMALVISEFVYP